MRWMTRRSPSAWPYSVAPRGKVALAEVGAVQLLVGVVRRGNAASRRWSRGVSPGVGSAAGAYTRSLVSST